MVKAKKTSKKKKTLPLTVDVKDDHPEVDNLIVNRNEIESVKNKRWHSIGAPVWPEPNK